MAELAVALALAGIALLRPWYDGMSLPASNTYFLWVQGLLFALVAARMLVRGEALRFPVLVGLLAAFLAVALAATLGTAQYNNSYRTLIVWSGHFFIFVVASQTLRHPRSFAIVFTGFVVGALTQAIFSVIHLKYFIPLMRESVSMDPTLVQRYFGAQEVTAEIARRLNSNRAFGSFLFPNALAGYMVLCIPFAVGAAVYSFRNLRAILGAATPSPFPTRGQARQTAAAAGFGAWVVTLLVAYIAYSMFHDVAHREQPISAHWLQVVFWVGALPVLVGGALYFITQRHGLWACWWTACACVLPCFAAATAAALFYSFSRGGMLAFVTATAFTGCCVFVLVRRPRLLPSRWAGAALLVVAWAAVATPGDTRAEAPPSQELITEGIDMTAEEFVNPATMLIRLSYWQSGLAMIGDNLWTGVGPGNFGVMYPRYKYVGAGETKYAHNDYLQITAETGIFGAIVFCAFWAVFVAGALKRLVELRGSPRLWLAAGLFASLLAFLFHAAIDFDFFNPSLAAAAFLLAGVFCAYTDRRMPSLRAARYARPVGAVFLVCVTVAVAASLRVHRADALAGSETDFRARLMAAQFFVFQAPEQYARDRRAANISLHDALALVPDVDALTRCGALWVAEPGRAPRRLGPHEPLWHTAYLNITDPVAARETGIQAAEEALRRLEDADAIFPHDPIRAVQLSAWCELLAEAADTQAERLEWSNLAVEWAEEALRRSPHEAWFHEQYAAVLWSRAQFAEDPEARFADLDKALEHYEQSTLLFSSSFVVWNNYAQVLAEMADILERADETKRAHALREKAGDAAARAQEIRIADYHANRRRAGLD